MRLFTKKLNKKNVVVYNMGHDKGDALFNALSQNPDLHVRQVHTLDRAKIIPTLLRHGDTPEHIICANDILQRDMQGAVPVTFITPVPDPFVKHVRHSFEHLSQITRDKNVLRTRVAHADLCLQHFNEIPAKQTLHWFENEYLPATGINVFQHQFDKNLGYAIHKIGIHSLVLISEQMPLGSMQKKLSQILSVELLGLEKAHPPSSTELQDLFMANLLFAKKNVTAKKFWQSPYSKHFFNDNQMVTQEAELEANLQEIAPVNDVTPPAPEPYVRQASLKKQDPAAVINACLKGRNFMQGIVFAGAADILSDRERRLRLQCHAQLHQFENVIHDFNMLEERTRQQAGIQLYYLRALANLGHTQELGRYIRSICLDMRACPQAQEFLLNAYPFSVYVSDELAAMVRARLMGVYNQFGKQHINLLLRVAHDLLNVGQLQDAYALAQHIDGLEMNTVNRCKMDILSAQNAFNHQCYDTQMDALNRVFLAQKSEPLQCSDTSQAMRFENLSCPSVVPRSVRGPLVSVIVPAWNCANTLEYVVRSLINQSYGDIEILIVDDASTDNTLQVAQNLAQQDERIVVIAQPQNMGTYVARNRAMSVAKGVFVTCQDADDWAHPQKIEKNVTPLLGNTAQIAGAVQHVRYDPQRGFRGLGGYIRFDASSMLFRRSEVIERIGYYDSVRVGGDSEYQYRMERQFGQGAFKQLPDMLSLVLWSEQSLSGGGPFAIDDDAGIFTPFRNAYRGAFCKWQECAGNLYMPFPLEKRLFDVPSEGQP